MAKNIDQKRVLELLADCGDRGMQPAELATLLGLDKGQRSGVRHALQALVQRGVVVHSGRRYSLNKEKAIRDDSLVIGQLQMANRGRAFVDRGAAYDGILIREGDIGSAMDGDHVEVRTWQGPRRTEGEIVRIVERGRKRLTGILNDPTDSLKPDDPRLPERILVEDALQARSGQVVLAEITRYPSGPVSPLAVKVTRILGEPGDLLTEVAKEIHGRGILTDFPKEVMQQADATPLTLSEEEFVHRVDMRDRTFVTIDPQSARDFDDAVAIEQRPNGFTRVWVAVADASHYVPENSAIDKEARSRGCSIYLPDRAIPMLPEALSSHLCSLVPNEDRLAMVVELDVDAQGAVVAQDCVAAVIHSRARFDYAGVAAALSGDFRGQRAHYESHIASLEGLNAVAQKLRKRRMARGALELSLPEAKILLDSDDPRRIRGIVEDRGEGDLRQAYSLIEELAVAANEAVGRLLEGAEFEAIWRVHAPPEFEALTQLTEWLSGYGIQANVSDLTKPKGMAKLLRKIQEHRAKRPLCYLSLRALSQACYQTENGGHFGLASKTYLHFTSPIRRYPDIHVHRLVKKLLQQNNKPAGTTMACEQRSEKELQGIATETSRLERRAMETERGVRAIYSAAIMREHIGDELEGMIIGLTSFGFFVSLDEPFVEGLVKLESLRQSAEFDRERMRIVTGGGRVTYSLGDRLRVRVAAASVERRFIDLELLEVLEMDPGAPKSGPKFGTKSAKTPGSTSPGRRSQAEPTRRKKAAPGRGKKKRGR